jgi:hypothetical protein
MIIGQITFCQRLADHRVDYICMRSDDNLCVSQSCAGSRWVSLVAVNAIKTRLPKNVLHIPLHSDSQGRAHLQTLP